MEEFQGGKSPVINRRREYPAYRRGFEPNRVWSDIVLSFTTIGAYPLAIDSSERSARDHAATQCLDAVSFRLLTAECEFWQELSLPSIKSIRERKSLCKLVVDVATLVDFSLNSPRPHVRIDFPIKCLGPCLKTLPTLPGPARPSPASKAMPPDCSAILTHLLEQNWSIFSGFKILLI